MRSVLKICSAILVAGLLSPSVWADTDRWSSFSQRTLARQYVAAPSPRVSANEAAAKVQRRYGGRILAVETRQQKGEFFHRIKILTRKGIVRVVRIKAGRR